jgi:FAD/FMN-containing dehydrogenase
VATVLSETRTYPLAALRADLSGIEVIDDVPLVRQKSRDFYWYSPILKPLLRGKYADLVVVPRNEAEVIRATRACVKHRIPIVVRGGATGNYGQLVPLKGGVIIDMGAMKQVKWLKGGVARIEAGARLIDIDAATRPQGWELRWYPSTKRMATIGGFIEGGTGGIGSIRWGRLREPGAVLAMRMITAEDEPRAIELRGAEIGKAIHAYGTNGILTECEIPLSPSYPWVEAIVVFDDFSACARFGQALGEADGIIKNLVCACAWPLPSYFKAFRAHLPDAKHALLTMIADTSMETFKTLVAEHKGELTFERPHSAAPDAEDAGPLYEYTWNHTTLQVLKVDRTVTYLQTLFPAGRNLELIDHFHKHFGDEVMLHLEFQKIQGRITNSALQVVRFTTPERLQEIVKYHVDRGLRYANPHSYTLEDKGPKVIDADEQLEFKRQADPYGLLNPGKMSRWSPA